MKALQTAVLVTLAGICIACGDHGPLSPSPVPTHSTQPTSNPPTTDPPVSTPVPGSWSDDFSGGVLSSQWQANGGGRWGVAADHVDMSQGMLGLRLTQTRNADGSFTSTGGEVQSLQTYGFGTYTWVARMSSTASTPNGPGNSVSGSSSGVFNFFNNSETEIDYEVEGNHPNTVHMVTWHITLAPTVADASAPSDTGFHEYKFVWYSDRIERYIDGAHVATQTTAVPVTPAYVMMNHWGTCCSSWGGPPTEGTRYMWVRSFSFVPNR